MVQVVGVWATEYAGRQVQRLQRRHEDPATGTMVNAMRQHAAGFTPDMVSSRTEALSDRRQASSWLATKIGAGTTGDE